MKRSSWSLLSKVGDLTLTIGNATISQSSEVHRLGVTLDSSLSFQAHIKSVTKSIFFNLKNIS